MVRQLERWRCIILTYACTGRGDEIGSRSRSPTPSLSSLPEDAPHAKILRFLRVLHRLNAQESERAAPLLSKRVLPPSAFVNNKLTAKLTRQLEEPMIVARYASLLSEELAYLTHFAARAYLTGRSIYLNTSLSSSRSRPATTSCNRHRLATLA